MIWRRATLFTHTCPHCGHSAEYDTCKELECHCCGTAMLADRRVWRHTCPRCKHQADYPTDRQLYCHICDEAMTAVELVHGVALTV